MKRINSNVLRRARHHAAYQMLRLIAKSALVSMLFFSGALGDSASAAPGDGLPPDCCRFFSETDIDSFTADVPVFRSSGRSAPSRVTRQPIVCLTTTASLRHWEFDYQASPRADSALVNSALGNSLAMSMLSDWGMDASMFQSLMPLQPWVEFEISLETQAKFAILKRALEAEAPSLISTNLLHPTLPLPVQVVQMFERAIWKL